MRTLIAIPVFNGYDALERCLSALASTEIRSQARVLIVNDASPDARIAPRLDSFAISMGKSKPERDALPVQVRHNATNRGFTWNVNQAIGARQSGEHLLLLNSDTIVTDFWLDEMLATIETDPKIGTVTPFSNNATICSLPDFSREWPVPTQPERERLAKALASSRAAAIDIPTAVGFCMLIASSCIERIGKFDTENFPRGYGEENDFCMRARGAGFRNVLCPNAYVAHEGGQSFSDEKRALMEAGGRRLLALYPNYNDLVADWIARDPAKARRDEIATRLDAR